MKMMVRRRTLPQKYVKDAWNDLPPEYYKKLINSIPRRIEAAIEANGNRISY